MSDVVDNMEGMTAAGRRRTVDEWLARTAAFGQDPQTREQAAAHEAGHAVLTAVLRWQFGGSKIQRDGTRWTGVTRFHHRLAGQPFTAAAEPGMAFAHAVQLLAGQLGEVHAGTWHPASSCDEQMAAAGVCAQLDALKGLPPGTTFDSAAAFVTEAIEANAAVFDVIRTHLAREKSLSIFDGRRMLSKVTAPQKRKGSL